MRAFLLGTLGVGLLTYVAAAAVALSAEIGGSELDVRIGRLALVAVDSSGDSTSLTLGAGLLVLALAGGVANAIAAGVLSRRTRLPPDRIH